MKLLTKYMIKSHTRLLFMTLAIGVCIFILIDLIEKADIFMGSRKPLLYALEYYCLKMPFIVSQTLPSIFLLSSVIFLSLMVSSREAIALQAGGVSIYEITINLIGLGIFWAVVQFVLSQMVMYATEQKAFFLWRYEVRERVFVENSLENVWFLDSGYIVHVGLLYERGHGENLVAYKVNEETQTVDEIIRAKTFTAYNDVWTLENAKFYYPEKFLEEQKDTFILPVNQSVHFYFISNQEEKTERLSFFLLGEAIERLRASGSNIENMQTIWHSKITYPVMIAVFAVLAVAIVSYNANIYLAVMLAVVVSFLSYVLSSFGMFLGQSGKVPPVFGAWFPCVLLFVLGYLKIYSGFSKR